MKVQLRNVWAQEVRVVLGAAGEPFRQSHELPPSTIVHQTATVSEVATGVPGVTLDVPFNNEAIAFLATGNVFNGARSVGIGQTHGDPYRVIRLDVEKAGLTVDIGVVEEFGPEPGDQVNAAAEVEWGDGGYESVSAPAKDLSHAYASPGSYDIHIRFGYSDDPRPSFAHHHVVLD